MAIPSWLINIVNAVLGLFGWRWVSVVGAAHVTMRFEQASEKNSRGWREEF